MGIISISEEKSLMFDVVKKISRNNNYLIKEYDLSKILIGIDKESRGEFVLTPVIEGLEGLTTPQLYTVIQDFTIYSIIRELEEGKKAYTLTNEGNEYIKEKIAEINLHNPKLYNKFSSIADSVISKYFSK
ncbi:hypothetical protein COZ55_00480 [archaeon CG_4_8_14_3_um_filter_38_5]|nr:MAG: hypothetical protein COS83_04545 [archaeon CG07_land_8_20_14_0_80_38_8]PIU88086.1 MAG: hypothetical protein COS64_04720 [archaeon CG06_land_8_20_14_3_00_37_11]PIX44332.1 MAG: hypothetical protein COZ55_00480 [archaeon CG_4_8_14_3_um_filter_38_5]